MPPNLKYPGEVHLILADKDAQVAVVGGMLARVAFAAIATGRATVYCRSGKIFNKVSVGVVPRKVRELAADYLRAGFRPVKKQGKGSHRKYRHPLLPGSILLAGQDGADAKPYQEQELRDALEKLEQARKRKP